MLGVISDLRGPSNSPHSVAALLPHAFSAPPASIGTNDEVVTSERVSVNTVSLARVYGGRTNASENVFPVWDRIEMIWIYTEAIAAKVVQEVRRIFSFDQGPDPAMRLVVDSVPSQDAVPLSFRSSSPNPTRRFKWSWLLSPLFSSLQAVRVASDEAHWLTRNVTLRLVRSFSERRRSTAAALTHVMVVHVGGNVS